MLAVIVISAVALALYVSPLLSLVVALITKATAPSGLKAAVLVVLSAVTAIVAPVVQNGGDLALDSKTLGAFAAVLIAAISAHFGVWKPLGLTGSAGVVSAMKIPLVPELDLPRAA